MDSITQENLATTPAQAPCRRTAGKEEARLRAAHPSGARVRFEHVRREEAENTEAQPELGTAQSAMSSYRLLVCLADAGRVAGVAVPFHTAPDATKALPPPSLEAARKLSDAGRLADALMLVTQLPSAERQRAEVQELEKDLRKRLANLSSSAGTPRP